MTPPLTLLGLPGAPLLDFALACVFFVALIYTVLKPRFGGDRPVVAMAVTLGLALAVGLAWWERSQGWSSRDLGPVALLLMLLLFVVVVLRSLRGQGWKAGLLVLAAAAMIASLWLPERDWSAVGQAIQTMFATILVLGIFWFLLRLESGHRRPDSISRGAPVRDRTQTDRGRRVGAWIAHNLERTRRLAKAAENDPRERTDVLLQIRRMLPAEGWLTERMARLREQAHLVRSGHLARLKEAKETFRHIPVGERKRVSERLVARYRAVVGIDTRLERLDHAVAACEKRIREVTKEAERAVARHEFPRVSRLLTYAEKLQKHNTHLLKKISSTETTLSKLVRDVTGEAAGPSS